MRMKAITFVIPFNIDSLSKLHIEAENFKREVENFYTADESIFFRILSKTFSFVMKLSTRYNLTISKELFITSKPSVIIYCLTYLCIH